MKLVAGIGDEAPNVRGVAIALYLRDVRISTGNRSSTATTRFKLLYGNRPLDGDGHVHQTDGTRHAVDGYRDGEQIT
jgi:hypothetical protein